MESNFSAADALDSSQCSPVAPPVSIFLRLEALAVFAATLLAYAHIGGSWWLFAVLWLAPDLSILGYQIDSCWGARTYNAMHTYITPATLAFAAWLLHQRALLPCALIWINHIAVDRMLGYGLKYPRGFGWTHLGKLGRRK